MFIERYVIFTSVFLYLFMAGITTLFETKTHIKTLLLAAFIALYIGNTNLSPSNNRDIKKLSDFIHSVKEPETLLLVCPAYYHYAFTYHYNTAYFSDYKNTIRLLEADNIYLISDLMDLQIVLSYKNSPEIIFFEAVPFYTDPQGEMKHLIKGSYILKEKRNFFEFYSVSLFSERTKEHL